MDLPTLDVSVYNTLEVLEEDILQLNNKKHNGPEDPDPLGRSCSCSCLASCA